MYLCYIDESGGFEAPRSGPGATPLMAFGALIVPVQSLPALTTDFIATKRKFYPGKADKHLDYLRAEIKGADLRSAIRSTSRNRQRHALGVLDATVGLLEKYGVKLLGRVWIKELDTALDPASTYSFAIQDLARHFNRFLLQNKSTGLILCDARDPRQDSQLSHSLFTMKYKASGDALPRLVEPTVFGRSENHAGLQLADLVVSGLVFPMAARAYCAGFVPGNDMKRRLDVISQRYGERLKSLRYTYKDGSGRNRGGVIVSDRLAKRPSGWLFREPTQDTSLKVTLQLPNDHVTAKA